MSKPRVTTYRIRKQCTICHEYSAMQVVEIKQPDGRVSETHHCLRCGGKKGVTIR